MVRACLFLFATLVAALAWSSVLAEPAPEGGIEWRDDLAAARALAAESGRPLMVVFR